MQQKQCIIACSEGNPICHLVRDKGFPTSAFIFLLGLRHRCPCIRVLVCMQHEEIMRFGVPIDHATYS